MLHFFVTLYLVSMLNVTNFRQKVLNVTIHQKFPQVLLFWDIECAMLQILVCNVTTSSQCNIGPNNLAECNKFRFI